MLPDAITIKELGDAVLLTDFPFILSHCLSMERDADEGIWLVREPDEVLLDFFDSRGVKYEVKEE